VYSTYLGGPDTDWPRAIALDGAGNAHVGGRTESPSLATAGALQRNKLGSQDAFLAKMGPAGALLYFTYLGGSAQDEVNGLAVGSDGHVYAAGWTKSANFPTRNPLQAALRTRATSPAATPSSPRSTPRARRWSTPPTWAGAAAT
jgi:hypothetical protein